MFKFLFSITQQILKNFFTKFYSNNKKSNAAKSSFELALPKSFYLASLHNFFYLFLVKFTRLQQHYFNFEQKNNESFSNLYLKQHKAGVCNFAFLR